MLRALEATYPEDGFALLAPEPGRWWSAGLPRLLVRDGYTLFHGTDFAVPYLPRVAAVMTLHDLSPWRPEWREETSARVRRRTPWLLRLGLATMVITPSEAVRREAIARFKLDAARVRAVPHGVDARFRPQPASAHPPYLLTVGTEGKRKNLAVAIEAARAAGSGLYVIGRGNWPPSTLGVRYLGPVADDELPQLYAGATAFLFPSHYEGFGLPMLEAMACGTPVIASTDPALREVAGGAALHCDAKDPSAWIDAIRYAQANREELSVKARSKAAEFTWTHTARLTHEVYEEALCRRAAR